MIYLQSLSGSYVWWGRDTKRWALGDVITKVSTSAVLEGLGVTYLGFSLGGLGGSWYSQREDLLISYCHLIYIILGVEIFSSPCAITDPYFPLLTLAPLV